MYFVLISHVEVCSVLRLAYLRWMMLLVDIVLQNVDLHATFIGKIYFTSVNIIKFDKVPLMCIPNFAVHYTAHRFDLGRRTSHKSV